MRWIWDLIFTSWTENMGLKKLKKEVPKLPVVKK